MSCRRNRSLNRVCTLLTVVGLTLFTVIQSSRADDADKTYPIRFSNPRHVGEKYPRTAKATLNTHTEVIVAGGQPIVQDKAMAVELQGTIEVLEVDKNGQETKLACTVGRCVQTSQNPPTDILPQGAVVTVSGRNQFALKDGQLTAEQTAALHELLETRAPDAPTDDMIFGIEKPQKVGASWPIDKQKAIADFARTMPITIKPENFDGSSTLAGVSKIDGQEYLQVKGNIAVRHMSGALPNGMTSEDSEFIANFAGIIPADGKGHVKSQSMDVKMDMKLKGAGANGAPVTVHVVVNGHHESQ